MNVKYWLSRVFNDPIYVIRICLKDSGLLSDKSYLKLLWKIRMGGGNLNLSNPKTFNEKLQWLKLYNRNPLYTSMVDKYAVKEYVKSVCPELNVIPTLGVYNNVDEINFNDLPNQFVLKCTHDSGTIVICKDIATFNIEEAKRKLAKALATDYYKLYREWPYKNVPRRIIAEQFISPATSNHNEDLKDYKFFCFDGRAEFYKIDFGRFTEHHANYYSTDGKLLPFGEKVVPPDYSHKEFMPENLDCMIGIANRLSENIPFLRVDLYNISGIIYFGEMTFYPTSGLGAFVPEEYDNKLGNLIKLPNLPNIN